MPRVNICWAGLLGLLGILGFVSGPFYFVFFMFFGFFWVMPPTDESSDRHLKANWSSVVSAMAGPLFILCFVVLYMLQEGVATSLVLTVGSLLFAAIMVFTPALAFWLGRRG
jgi:hypothetical protein